MIYSYKSLLLISTTVVLASTAAGFLIPIAAIAGIQMNAVVDYIYTFTVLQEAMQTTTDWRFIKSGSVSPLYWGFLVPQASSFFLKGNYLFSTVGTSALVFSSVFNCFRSLLGYLFIVIITFYFFSSGNLARSFSRLYSFLKNTVTTGLPFLNFFDLVVIFIFFFMSVYFLEVHFFFIFLFGGSSDSTNYQFNFLLSSFFFVFLVKTLGGVYSQSLLFSVSAFNQSFFNFYSGIFFKVFFKKKKDTSKKWYSKKNQFALASSLVIYFFLNSFFFLSTFLVWFLRFCIQFVRLMVLFIVHTVFEFIVIGSDFYFSGINAVDFFVFKSFFLFFFYFFGFLYLMVYLNLMFTLQIFIFYFFSEIFQSNFIFDLSAISLGKLKK